MSNPFFTNTIDLLPATKARAGDVESNLTAVEAGFDEAKQYFDRTLRGARANPAIAEIPDAATRANKALTFDASGNPVATVTTTEISNAQTYANNAQNSANASAASAASAAASFDSFDDRYLGPKASDPTADNDGAALLEGALYWNTTAKEMRAWSGAAWVTTSAANAVSRGGDTMTGNLGFSGTGLRLTGDFSNATAANRLAIQTSTVNGNTTIEVLPNGTGATSVLVLESDSSATTGSNLQLSINGTAEARVTAAARGAGPAIPLKFWTSNGEKLSIDTSGNVLVTGSGGLGYGVGSGGTVTQATSKATTVVLNKPSGQITMNAAALAAGASVAFQVTNSVVDRSCSISVVGVNGGGNPDAGNYRIEPLWVDTGAFAIRVTNISAGSLSEALRIQFNVHKGAIS